MKNRNTVSKSWLAGLLMMPMAILAFTTPNAHSQSTSVFYHGGLITIRCSDATLEQVFEQIKSETGLELFLEDPVKSKRLTADIEAQPVNQALERLLVGAGVNYAMMFDREDWQRVDKIFVGEGGGAFASSQPAPNQRNTRRARRKPQPVEQDEGLEDPSNINDYDDTGEGDGDFQDEAPAPAVDPGYLPPPPAFPRSSFTPGLESSPFGAQTYYPFTDQFGRPIPVSTDPNASQQQEDQKQQEQQ